MIEFKGSDFERDVILWRVRWYLAYPISYRRLEEMMEERGVEVDHSTLNLWVVKYVPLLDQQICARKAFGWLQLANGRDICEGQRPLEVFVSGRWRLIPLTQVALHIVS